MTPDATLQRLARSLATATDPAEIVDALTDAAHAALGADAVHVSEISQDRAVAHARGYRYGAGVREPENYVQVIDDRPSGTARVLATGEPLHAPDATQPGLLRPDYVQRFGIASALFVPLAWGGEVRWVQVLIASSPRTFADDEIARAQMLADQAAAGLALIEERSRAAAQAGRDEALMRAANVLNQDLPRQDVLQALMKEADLALGGDMSGVYLGDAERGGVATAGHNAPDDWYGYVLRPGEGVGGQVLATGESVITNAYQSEVRIPRNEGLRQVRTAVSVPVVCGGELRGALSVGFTRMRRVTQDDLRTLQAIANLVAIACRRD